MNHNIAYFSSRECNIFHVFSKILLFSSIFQANLLIIGAWKRGWKLPEDMAVMGVNNSVFAGFTDPGLSTVSFPYSYLAERTLSRAMELSRGETEFGNFTLPPLEVVIRDSCGGKTRCTPEKLQEILDFLGVKAVFDNSGIGRE